MHGSTVLRRRLVGTRTFAGPTRRALLAAGLGAVAVATSALAGSAAPVSAAPAATSATQAVKLRRRQLSTQPLRQQGAANT